MALMRSRKMKYKNITELINARGVYAKVGEIYPIDYISSGWSNSFIIKEGALWGAGIVADWSPNKTIFQQYGTDEDWIKVSNHNHVLAIKTDGTLWAMGDNYYGQLGLGDKISRGTFVRVGSRTDWINVWACLSSTFAQTRDGKLWSVGYNYWGTLGLGDNSDRRVFNQVGSDTDWETIYPNGYLAFGKKTDGSLWFTGKNNTFEGGVGLTSYIYSFTKINNDTDWDNVSNFNGASYAVKTDGTMWSAGTMFNPTWANVNERAFFSQITANNNWLKVSEHFAIKKDGSLWLGSQISNVNNNLIVHGFTISFAGIWEDLSSHQGASLLLDTNRELWFYGNNQRYQLGILINNQIGGNTGIPLPFKPKEIKRVRAILFKE